MKFFQSYLILTLVSIIFISCENNRKPAVANLKPKSSKIDNKSFPLAEIKFENRAIDFGNVSNDTTLVGLYKFTNPSNDTLRIDYVNPDCTCTRYEVSNYKIAPGASGVITLIFSTKAKVMEQALYAIVHTNTKEKFHKLSLRCNIE